MRKVILAFCGLVLISIYSPALAYSDQDVRNSFETLERLEEGCLNTLRLVAFFVENDAGVLTRIGKMPEDFVKLRHECYVLTSQKILVSLRTPDEKCYEDFLFIRNRLFRSEISLLEIRVTKEGLAKLRHGCFLSRASDLLEKMRKPDVRCTFTSDWLRSLMQRAGLKPEELSTSDEELEELDGNCAIFVENIPHH
jgi:hypothetical protein